MATSRGLSGYDIIGFIPIFDVARAKHFYRDTLGLALISEELPFALVFDANGTMVRLAIFQEAPKTVGTVLGWRVTAIEALVSQLVQAGVEFARYPYLEQDAAGIWTAPGGAKIAWFEDPDGNTLSISEHP